MGITVNRSIPAASEHNTDSHNLCFAATPANSAIATNTDMEFHMAFFAGGLQAVCNAWIRSGMKKTPEQMADVILDEYKDKSVFFNDKPV